MTDLPTPILAALMEDAASGCHAVLMAWAFVSDDEGYLVSIGRPGVLPPDPQVEHYDYKRPVRERMQEMTLADVPEGLEWTPRAALVFSGEEAERHAPPAARSARGGE